MPKPPRETDDPLGKKLLQVLRETGHEDDLNELARQLQVKVQSTYDYIKHGRIAKDRYPLLVQWSGRSLDWWFDVPRYSATSPQAAPMVSEPIPFPPAQGLDAALPLIDPGRITRCSLEERAYLQGVVNTVLSELEARRANARRRSA